MGRDAELATPLVAISEPGVAARETLRTRLLQWEGRGGGGVLGFLVRTYLCRILLERGRGALEVHAVV